SAVQHVLSGSADQDVISVVAVERIVAGAADQHIGAVAAIEHELRAVGAYARRVDDVIAAETGDVDRGVGVEVDDDLGGAARHYQGSVLERQREDVVAAGAVDGDGVVWLVGGAVAPGCVDVHLLDGGAGQVADRDVVGAAQRFEVDGLDAVEIYRDAG